MAWSWAHTQEERGASSASGAAEAAAPPSDVASAALEIIGKAPHVTRVMRTPMVAGGATVGIGFLVVAVAVVVVPRLWSALGLPAGWMYVLAIIAAVTLAAVGLVAGVRVYKRNMRFARMAWSASDQHRVMVVGDVAAQQGLGEITTQPFEPVIVPARFAEGRSAGVVALSIAYTGLFFASAWLLLPRSMLTSMLSFGYAAVLGSTGLAMLTMGWVFPVYYRVAPGRLDILRFGPLGVGRPSVRSFDMRSSGVTVMLRARVVLIDVPGQLHAPLAPPSRKLRKYDLQNVIGPPATAEVNYSMVPEPLGFARAVLASAISPHPTPPMPDDELIG